MRVAHCLASRSLPEYSSKFSRRDFTVPQLFACLVVREHQKQTYRGCEALLRDSDHWCRDIGMKKVPDHNTLWRAFCVLNLRRRAAGRLLDVLAEWFAVARRLGETVANDSTLHDTHHRSRHYERRLRRYATREKKAANLRRSRSARRTPKLAFAVDTATHLILAARPRIGMGADCRDFEPLLLDAWRRYPGKRLRRVLADAGYDSHPGERYPRGVTGSDPW